MSSNKGCPNARWHRYKNKCFFAESHTFHTFETNRRNCEAGGGTLASIRSAEENRFLEKVVLRPNCSYWIGIDHFTAGKMDYRWMDRTPFNYSNWNPGEPNDYNLSCTRTYMNKGHWEDAPCRWTRCALCQITIDEDDNDFPSNFTGKAVSVEDFQRVVVDLRKLYEQVRETRISQELLEDVNDKLLIQATYWEGVNGTLEANTAQMRAELQKLTQQITDLKAQYVTSQEMKASEEISPQSSKNRYGAVFFIFIVVGLLLVGFFYAKLSRRGRTYSSMETDRRDSFFDTHVQM